MVAITRSQKLQNVRKNQVNVRVNKQRSNRGPVLPDPKVLHRALKEKAPNMARNYLVPPNAPKKFARHVITIVRSGGLPKPFDYKNKPRASRKLFTEPTSPLPPMPDYSRLPVAPVPVEPKSHRHRSMSRLHDGLPTPVRRRLLI